MSFQRRQTFLVVSRLLGDVGRLYVKDINEHADVGKYDRGPSRLKVRFNERILEPHEQFSFDVGGRDAFVFFGRNKGVNAYLSATIH